MGGCVSCGELGTFTENYIYSLNRITTMPKGQIKMTPADKAWAAAVKKRDGFACVICGSTERLNSHHILPRELHDTKLDISNGITLCCKHHLFSREISAHNNPLSFIVWLGKHRPEQLAYLMEKCEGLEWQ